MTTTERPAPIIVDATTWRGKALVPVLVYVGLLVAVVSSLGAPLVPSIATDYGVSLGTAQWSLTITLLVGAVSSPVVGRFGDGPRRLHVLLASLGVLVVGSVFAALPVKAFALLILGRAMQGIGLALLPLAMSVARDHLPPERARATLATLSVTAVVGVGLGYPLTGVIAEHLNLHAGFWLAAALGLIAMVLSALVVPTSRHRESKAFDLAGAALLGLGLAGLLLSISEGENWGWLSGRLLLLGGLSVVVILAWIWHELRIQLPLVDLRMMRNRTVLTANVTGVMAGVGMYMMMSMIIRYVQTPSTISYGMGASVVVAGLVLLPLSVASFTASKLVTYVSRWIGPQRILPIGVLAFALSLLLFATNRGQLWQPFVEMGIGGIGIGCSFAVMPRMIVSAIPPEETSSALALNQVLRTVGYSIGSALAAAILTAHTVATEEFPRNAGYTSGAVIGIALLVVTAVVSFALPTRGGKPRAKYDAEQELSVEESVDSALAGVIAFEPDLSEDPNGPTARARR
ncbi:MAG: Major facilitator superfamily 1 [Frankiales bacterium]|nr:Major facilitator superfamily 1 [Frankiales bacterium]